MPPTDWVAREIERIDSGYRSMMSVQSSLVTYPILAYGSHDQKERYLPSMIDGSRIGCFGLTEPDAGSDPVGMAIRAVKTKHGYQPSGDQDLDFKRPHSGCLRRLGAIGESRWKREGVCSGPRYGWFGDAEDRRETVAAGIDCRPDCLNDVDVPDDAMLSDADGLGGPFGCLNRARYGISWGVIGGG